MVFQLSHICLGPKFALLENWKGANGGIILMQRLQVTFLTLRVWLGHFIRLAIWFGADIRKCLRWYGRCVDILFQCAWFSCRSSFGFCLVAEWKIYFWRTLRLRFPLLHNVFPFPPSVSNYILYVAIWEWWLLNPFDRKLKRLQFWWIKPKLFGVKPP